MQDRVRFGPLVGIVAGRRFGGEGKPGPDAPGRWPTVVVGPVPGERRPASVPASGVDRPLGRDIGIEEAQLLALVEERGPPQGQEQHRGRPGPELTPALGNRRRFASGEGGGVVARPVPGVVVVGQHPGRPGVTGLQGSDGGGDAPAPVGLPPRREQRREVEGQMEFVSPAVIGRHLLGGQQEDLADDDPVPGVAVEEPADVPQSRWVTGTSLRAEWGMPAISGGSSGSRGSLPMQWMTSARIPSTPRSSQNRRTSCIASTTPGSSQLRSGWADSNRWRYHWLDASSNVQAGADRSKEATQLLGGDPSEGGSRQTYQLR